MDIQSFIKREKRRITGLYMLRRRWRLGLRKTAVGLRPLCGFSPPYFGPPQTYGLLYGRAKTSYTAGTLSAIFSETFWNNGGGGIHAAAK
jgi:hypothetical protein